MRLATRALVVLALPGAAFGFLTQIPPPAFDSVGDAFTVHEPLLDALTALALAAAAVVVAAIVLGALFWLGFGSDTHRQRRAGRRSARPFA